MLVFEGTECTMKLYSDRSPESEVRSSSSVLYSLKDCSNTTVISVVSKSSPLSGMTPGLWMIWKLVSTILFRFLWTTTHSLLSLNPGSISHGIVGLLHVRGMLGRILMRCFVEKDSMHLDALRAVGPARIRSYVLNDIVENAITIAGPHVSHCSRIRERIESLNGWEVILVGQRRVSRSAVRIDNNGVIEA